MSWHIIKVNVVFAYNYETNSGYYEADVLILLLSISFGHTVPTFSSPLSCLCVTPYHFLALLIFKCQWWPWVFSNPFN